MKTPEISAPDFSAKLAARPDLTSIAFSIEEIKRGIRKAPHVAALLTMLFESACGFTDLKTADTLDGGKLGLSTAGTGGWIKYSEANLVQRGYPPESLKNQLRGQIVSQLLSRMGSLSDSDEVLRISLRMADELVTGAVGKDNLVYQDLLADLAYEKGISGDLIQYAAIATTAGLGVWATAIIGGAHKEAASNRRPNETYEFNQFTNQQGQTAKSVSEGGDGGDASSKLYFKK